MFLKSYGLPAWELISGEDKERIVTLRHENGAPYELGEVTARLQVIDCVNREMAPLLDAEQTVENNESGYHCNLRLSVTAAETAKLQGKYLYIAVITDDRGNVAKLRGPMIVYDKSIK